MEPEQSVPTTWRVKLANEGATRALAREVASFVGANDLVTLSGEIGAGKTTFARHLIRAVLGDDDVEVPSPTFTLMQVYAGPNFPVVHADLYRISNPDEIAELGWSEVADGALVAVEWIERAGDKLPADRLDIRFSLAPSAGEGVRLAEISAHGGFEPRLRRARAIHALLRTVGWSSARRAHMSGDASARLYERLVKPEASAVLMISPPRVDASTVQHATPYSKTARLAEDIKPFLAIGAALLEMGYSAPKILGVDVENGLAVLEDLGATGVVDENGPIPERYAEAVSVLADMHSRDMPTVVPLPDGGQYRVPFYDLDAYRVEAELLIDWYAISTPASMFNAASRRPYADMWLNALGKLRVDRPTWTLRDYHSPNLIWLADREGLDRVGIIDFQDCVLGHPAYDVVSLLQDARVTVPDDLEIRLLSRYARERRGKEPDFDMARFAEAYAVLGAQRAAKILGVFARLDKRDMKPQYLAHLPRVEAYLAKNLAHPALAETRAWFKAHVPAVPLA